MTRQIKFLIPLLLLVSLTCGAAVVDATGLEPLSDFES